MQAMAAGAVAGGQAIPGAPAAPLGGDFADAMAGALANMGAMQLDFGNAAYTLKFVKAGESGAQEKRCSLEVIANSAISEVIDMVKLEMNAESENLALEFCGTVLPATALVQLAGLGDGDTVKV